MKKALKYSLIEGAFRGIVFYAIGEYCVSTFFMYSHFANELIIGMVTVCYALLCGSLAGKLNHRKEFTVFYFSSLVIFLLFLGVIFVNYMSFHFFLLPRAELTNANGLIILVMEGSFFVLSALLRPLFVLYFFNKKTAR